MDYREPVYDFLRTHAGRDAVTGVLVTHAPLHPWLMETFGLTKSQADTVRTRTTKELEHDGRVRRDSRYTSKVWILK